MMRFKTVPVVLAMLFLASSLAMAGDAEIAAKLKGNWQGFWKMGERNGRLNLNITGSDEVKLFGNATWYGMATNEIKLPFDKAEVKDGTFMLMHNHGLTVDSKVSRDHKTMKGTWGSAAGGGAVEFKKTN